MPGPASLERAKNFTRITAENIIQAESPTQRTRRSLRKAPEPSSEPLEGEYMVPQDTKESVRQHNDASDISADSPDHSPRRRRGPVTYSRAQTSSRKQEQRHDPMTQVGRAAWKKRTSSTTATTEESLFLPESPETAGTQEILDPPQPASGDIVLEDVPQTTSEPQSDIRTTEPVEGDANAPPAPTDQCSDHSSESEVVDDEPDEYIFYEEAAAAVAESLRPKYDTIQRLAKQALSDPSLLDLMKIVGSGFAPRYRLRAFQRHMDVFAGTDDDPMGGIYEDPEMGGGDGEGASAALEDEPENEPELEADVSGGQENEDAGPREPAEAEVARIVRTTEERRQALGALAIASPVAPGGDDTASPASPRMPVGPPRRREGYLRLLDRANRLPR